MWQTEVLYHWPNRYCEPIENWAMQLRSLNWQEKVHYLNHYQCDRLSDDFQNHLQKTLQLIDLDQLSMQDEIALDHYRLTPKKRHERNHILNFLQQQQIQPCYFWDFAGGMGHLSRGLSKVLQTAGHCLDADENLITSAHDFANEQVEFEVQKIEDFDATRAKNNHLMVGLHCCGELTPQILQHFESSEASWLLSVGCCYFKDSSNYPLENEHISFHAKMLAAKGFRPVSVQDLQTREQVKTYRYYFEFWYREQFPHHPVTVLKSFLPHFYQGSFDQYFKECCRRLNLHPKDQPLLSELQQRYGDEFSRLISLGLLREIFSRPLEIYLTIQRALKLKSDFQIYQVFDRQISQRNLAIFSQKDGVPNDSSDWS